MKKKRESMPCNRRVGSRMGGKGNYKQRVVAESVELENPLPESGQTESQDDDFNYAEAFKTLDLKAV